MTIPKLFSKLFLLAVFSVVTFGLDLANFTTCISSAGSGSTCTLDSGYYLIDSPLIIGRDGITIEGTYGDAGDVVLQRTTTLGYHQSIMQGAGVVGVLVQYLTFDGNRQNTVNCDTAQGPYTDLDLGSAHVAYVEFVNFINAPVHAVSINTTAGYGDNSLIGWSNIGQGFVNSTYGYYESAPSTAARNTGVFLMGATTQIFGTNISYSGTAGINSYNGTDQLVYLVLLESNRYEMGDKVGGGQMYISDNSSGTTVASSAILGDGYRPVGNPVNGCSTTGITYPWPYGIESSGSNHNFQNNWVSEHYGFGMFIRSGSNITISTHSTLYPTQTPQPISHNGTCVWLNCFLEAGSSSSSGGHSKMAGINIDDEFGTVSNITLQDVLVQHNLNWGLYLKNVGGSPGFTNGSPGGTCVTDSNGMGYGAGNLKSPGSASGYTSFTNALSPCPYNPY